MATLWITYAWDDDQQGDVTFVAQELRSLGLDVKLDRWNIGAGLRLWDQIQEFISSEERSDGWLLYATENSLSSEACREELAYALNRALKKRGSAYPVLALFPGPVDTSLIPPAVQVRLHVSLSDENWQERIKAAVERRQPSILGPAMEPYYTEVHGNRPSGKIIIEVRPRAGTWKQAFVAIPIDEQERVSPSLLTGAAGCPKETGIVLMSRRGKSENAAWLVLTADFQATPSQSCYLVCQSLPTRLQFGNLGGPPQFETTYQTGPDPAG